MKRSKIKIEYVFDTDIHVKYLNVFFFYIKLLFTVKKTFHLEYLSEKYIHTPDKAFSFHEGGVASAKTKNPLELRLNNRSQFIPVFGTHFPHSVLLQSRYS